MNQPWPCAVCGEPSYASLGAEQPTCHRAGCRSAHDDAAAAAERLAPTNADAFMELIRDAANKMLAAGQRPTTVVLHPETYDAVERVMMERAVRGIEPPQYGGLEFYGMDIVKDSSHPPGRATLFDDKHVLGKRKGGR